ncbi:hypothetical protein RAB80_012867 [Fusarium oxysporum f. sp. vasinfectum]|nr:hypothetical protein RAB80_012867 [Fusarium oxysporum f. sp. vasinfectum]
MLSLRYQSLDDFTGLSAVREAVARGDTGLLIHDLPPLIRELPFKDIPQGYKAQKNDDANAAAVVLMQTLHGLSHSVFKTLSHPVANEWSTLSIILNTSCPDKALVTFGTALSVFTEGMTPEPPGSSIDLMELSNSSARPQGDWVVYYVRPNNGVFYTRTAGALMTPLSTEDYDERKRIQDLELV